LTLKEERITAIKQAILETVTWAQLAEVLEAVIAHKPKEDLLKAASGDGLVCRNRPRLKMLREHVRCSEMMPHSPAIYQSVETKLENAATSYDLVDVLILILNGFGESLVHLNEGRDPTDITKPFQAYSGRSKSNRTSEAERQEDVQRELIELRQAQRDEHNQLSMLMNGSLTADEFKGGGGSSNTAPSPPTNMGKRAIGVRHWGGGSGNGASNVTSKTLQSLNSSTRASISSMFKAVKEIQSNPLDLQTDLLSRAMRVLETVCVTMAGGAKVLLIAFHPRLSNVDKAQNFESAGLASAATDSDDMVDGERRLLRSIVTLYMGGRQESSDADAAHRAVNAATTKRDIIEILHVMVVSKVRSELPPVRGAIGYKKSKRQVDSNSGRKSRADRAAVRGNNFFEGDFDQDDVLVDGSKRRPKTTEEDDKKSNNSSDVITDESEAGGDNEKEFNVMQSVSSSLQGNPMQPSPPPPPKNRVRGPKGLRYIKSLNKTRQPGPPSSLSSYQGTTTLFKIK